MGRPKDAEVAVRNRMIVLELRQRNCSVPEAIRRICEKYELSPSRVYQVISETAPQMPDEDMRAAIYLESEDILEQLYKDAHGPGRAMIDGKGNHVIDQVTGEYAYDPSPRIQANEVRIRAVAHASRLYGLDKPPVKPAEESAGLQEFIAEYQKTIEENRAKDEMIASLKSRLDAIEGSVPAEVIGLGSAVVAVVQLPGQR